MRFLLWWPLRIRHTPPPDQRASRYHHDASGQGVSQRGGRHDMPPFQGRSWPGQSPAAQDPRAGRSRRAEVLRRRHPGMTMVYRVKDPAMLTTVKPGDKIKFDADHVNGQFIVTTIQKAK